MAKATEVLMSEHRGIERMLAVLERGVPRLEAGDATPVAEFAQGVDFLRGFADRCHHHKEEKLLFPALAARGFSVEAGPIAVMLAEHELGRRYIRGMDEAIQRYQAKASPEALRDLAAAASGYAQLLRAHIQKEDNVLFRMADQALTGQEQEKLAEEFERVEVEVMGIGTHERYHRMLDALG